jgi:hypothetical protein
MMRPPDLDVTFVLQRLDCFATEDAEWDEPYLWNVGFKVDAETLGPPPAGSLVPSLGVRVITGANFFTHVVGANSVKSGQSPAIHPLLGTRTLRLKPALLPLFGWFPGIAGVICLLWDEDGFAPSTAEAGFTIFKARIGPALTVELDRLVAGAYDTALAKDINGVTLPAPADFGTLAWRFRRLADPGGRKYAVDGIKDNVKNAVIGPVRDAITDAANWDELIDPDDLLGVAAQVYTGDELSGSKPFTLTFTEDDANYAAQGIVTARRAHRAVLDSSVIRLERILDRIEGLWRRVCWGPLKFYLAEAYRNHTTIRYELRPTLGEAPSSVRWFIDNTPLNEGANSVTVNFETAAQHFGAPADILAPHYPGGAGTIQCKVAGRVLEVANDGGNGVFFGKVRVLFAYAGDPTLFPPPATPVADLFGRGYDLDADLDLVAVELAMNEEYYEDVRQCARKIREFDRKFIPVNWGKGKIDPGDPPTWRLDLLEAVTVSQRVAGVQGLDMPALEVPTPLLRRFSAPR